MAQSPWGYDSDNGPARWHENYPNAKGDKQSPIEINSKEVKHEPSLPAWHASYDPGAAKTILNNGRTCRVVFDDSFDRSVLRGGPLSGAYRLRQLHLHWGSSDDHGSEHVIDGVKYAAEAIIHASVHEKPATVPSYYTTTYAVKMQSFQGLCPLIIEKNVGRYFAGPLGANIVGMTLHMVHWNPKHGNFAGALKQPDGVAVVGIFLKVGTTPKPEMKRILEEIDNIKTKGKEAPFQHFDPSILFPKSRDYWTYHGSFTTPPCEECITWILLREPIEVSPDQMARLRSLSKNPENEPMIPLVDNWRPPQPVKGRVVKASFK